VAKETLVDDRGQLDELKETQIASAEANLSEEVEAAKEIEQSFVAESKEPLPATEIEQTGCAQEPCL